MSDSTVVKLLKEAQFKNALAILCDERTLYKQKRLRMWGMVLLKVQVTKASMSFDVG